MFERQANNTTEIIAPRARSALEKECSRSVSLPAGAVARMVQVGLAVGQMKARKSTRTLQRNREEGSRNRPWQTGDKPSPSHSRRSSVKRVDSRLLASGSFYRPSPSRCLGATVGFLMTGFVSGYSGASARDSHPLPGVSENVCKTSLELRNALLPTLPTSFSEVMPQLELTVKNLLRKQGRRPLRRRSTDAQSLACTCIRCPFQAEVQPARSE